MTSQYGTLSTGDILRTSKEFAAHLVDDCAAAKYVQAKEPAEPVAPVEADEPKKKSTKRK